MSPHVNARQRGVLMAAGVANALIFLDQTSVTVALPAIQRDFDSSTAAVQWTIGAYLLPLAALMASSGRLGDLYGRKRMFAVGLISFGIGSIACALAPSDAALIGARVLQGAGAALTQPLALAHATAVVAPERRGWAIGVLASAGTTCLTIGPLVGGLLVEVASWRWIFALNAPLVAVALALAARFMREHRDDAARALDLPGLTLLTIGLGTLVAGLLHLREWPPALAGAAFLAALAALAGFVAVERRSAHPLLGLGLLRVPALRASLAALLVIQGAVLGVTVYVVLYVQNGLGLSPIEAGLVLLPAVIWTPLLSISSGRFADRHGTRPPVVAGLLLAALGLAAIGVAGRAEAALALLPGLLAFGLSRPYVFTPASAGAMASIPGEERGLAASLVTEARQLGAVLGVAVLGSIVAAFEHGEGTAARAEGLEAAMLAAAAVAALAAALAYALLPRSLPARRR